MLNAVAGPSRLSLLGHSSTSTSIFVSQSLQAKRPRTVSCTRCVLQQWGDSRRPLTTPSASRPARRIAALSSSPDDNEKEKEEKEKSKAVVVPKTYGSTGTRSRARSGSFGLRTHPGAGSPRRQSRPPSMSSARERPATGGRLSPSASDAPDTHGSYAQNVEVQPDTSTNTSTGRPIAEPSSLSEQEQEQYVRQYLPFTDKQYLHPDQAGIIWPGDAKSKRDPAQDSIERAAVDALVERLSSAIRGRGDGDGDGAGDVSNIGIDFGIGIGIGIANRLEQRQRHAHLAGAQVAPGLRKGSEQMIDLEMGECDSEEQAAKKEKDARGASASASAKPSPSPSRRSVPGKGETEVQSTQGSTAGPEGANGPFAPLTAGGIEAATGRTHKSQSKPTVLCRLDFQQVIPRIMASKVRAIASPSFYYRAVRTRSLPPNTPSPFPERELERVQEDKVQVKADVEVEVIRIGIMVPKSSISKFAVERNRTRTRFKAALRLAMDRAEREGKRLMTSGMTYLVTLKPACYSTDMRALVEEAYKAFSVIKPPHAVPSAAVDSIVRDRQRRQDRAGVEPRRTLHEASNVVKAKTEAEA